MIFSYMLDCNVEIICVQGDKQRGENTPETKTIVALERRELSGVSGSLFSLSCLLFFLFFFCRNMKHLSSWNYYNMFVGIRMISGSCFVVPWKSFGFMEYVLLLSWIAIFEQNTTKINCINHIYDFVECYHFKFQKPCLSMATILEMVRSAWWTCTWNPTQKKWGNAIAQMSPYHQGSEKNWALITRYNKDFTN
jgi:hypothetical protein